MAFDLSSLTTLARLASKEASDKAASAGLPVLEAAAFLTAVSKNKEEKQKQQMNAAVKLVTDIMSGAEKLLEELAGKTYTPIDGSNSLKQAADAKMAAKIAQAKTYAEETGNYVPLLAITEPNTNLKSLPKDVVVPDMSEIPKPLLSFSVVGFPKIVKYLYGTDVLPNTKVQVTGAPPNTNGYATGMGTVTFTTDATGMAEVWLDWHFPYDEIAGDESYTFVIPGCSSVQKTARVRVVDSLD